MASPFNSTVELMANVPLTPDYEHTLTFTSDITQASYFANKVVQTAQFTNLSYQRHTKGSIRLQVGMDLLDQVNYMRFQNRNYTGGGTHENKLFYAFITNMEYVSDAVTKIDYKIDVLQTWMFDYTVNPCYIEREHTNNDAIGANRIAEGLETGPYITPMIEKIDAWDSIYAVDDGDVIQNTTFVVIATQSPDGSQYSSQYNGVASSMYIRFAYNISGLEDILTAFRNGATQSLEPIVSIGMIPSYFKPNVNTPLNPKISYLTADASIGLGPFRCMDQSNPNNEKTYTPKNNKMYCYPYNYMTFESPDGSTIILKHEDFTLLASATHHQQFMTYVSILPEIETVCYPMDYEHVLQGTALTGRYMKYALYSKSYPYCAVASDAFSAWWAQNRYNYPIQAGMVDAADAISSATQSPIVPANGERSGILGFMDRVYNGTQSLINGLMGAFTGKSNVQLIGQLSSEIGEAITSGGRSLVSLPQTIASQNAAYEGHKAVPDTLVTRANNGGVNHYMENDCYKIHYTKIRPEYAQVIDNYFSCFGYATHVVKTPNVFGRLNWNYVKTVGCTINGNIPVEADEKIKQIYDRGVTFWHNPSTMFDYTQNNPIV